MNPNLLKYGLIGVALYFGYDWWKKQSTSPGAAPPTTTPPADAAAAVETPEQKAAREADAVRQAAADTEVARRQGTSTDPIRQVPDDQLNVASSSGVAAAVTESDRRGIRLNHHQWNYFRAQLKGPQPDPELWAPGTSGNPVLVSQYLAMRASAGMSGLGELGRAFPHLMWIT